jgi:hypothetical protein
MTQKSSKDSSFFFASGKQGGGRIFSNNNQKSFSFERNMFEVMNKQATILPSFLSLEPIPEFKVFDQVSVSVINFFFFNR